MTPDDLFWKLMGTVGVVLLTMLVTRIAAVAAARRVAYTAVGARLVELWRSEPPKKHEIFVELTKLVIDGNRDLDAWIDRLVDAVNGGDPDGRAQTLLLDLLDRMRATAFLANVRESVFGSGPPRAGLLAKLLRK